MATDDLVLHDVLVLHQTNLGCLCQVGDQQVFISWLEITPGTEMPHEGERGTVTIAAVAVPRVRKMLRG
jgi:hypothetical protein